MEHVSNYTHSDNSKKSEPRISAVKVNNHDICDIHHLNFSNCKSACNLTDSVYYRKTAARRFHSILDILRSLGLTQSLLKCVNLAQPEPKG